MKRIPLLSAACLLALAACTQQPRNLAHYRAAWQSSSTDFDLTAQLVTDGIHETRMPVFAEATCNGKPFNKANMEWLADLRDWCRVPFDTCDVSYTIDYGRTIDADVMRLKAQVTYKEGASNSPYWMEVLASEDGESWTSIYKEKGVHGPQLDPTWKDFCKEMRLPEGLRVKACKMELHGADIARWEVGCFSLMNHGERLYPLGGAPFQSAWVSAGTKDEWIYVDLGEGSRFDTIILDWLAAPEKASILVSNDAKNWKTVMDFTPSANDTLRLGKKALARYVKLAMDGCDGPHICLTEMEVWGTNNVRPRKSDWKVARLSEIDKPEAWIPANVPGTVLTSWIDNGCVPDVMYDDWNHNVSQSFFRSDFLYRGKMEFHRNGAEKVWLNFDGINWKADISLNGKPAGRIEGAFKKGIFDVTDLVREGENDVEVLIHANANPGIGRSNTVQREAFNGGILGRDNPTFHASIGWDWMPSLAGRNIGIWNDVYFSTTGPVRIKDEYTWSDLNADGSATEHIQATLENTDSESRTVTLSGKFGDMAYERTVILEAGERSVQTCDLLVEKPNLWWPVGYGDPYLYDVSMTATVDGKDSDTRSFKAGIRKMTYTTEGNNLRGYINGRRFIGKGGNWGFSEANLRFRAADYDAAVRYHREQNFTLIRNWVGQTGDEEFYDACDKYGVMVWQDFWLANPGDGPDPDDEEMFMDNADDMIRRIRRHPCISLYCGRNEGNPPATLDKALRAEVDSLTDIFYISHSSRGLVSGEGDYWRHTAEDTFKAKGQDKMHSERGMPNVLNWESMRRMIPEDQAWPQGQKWAEHDWTLQSAQRAGEFNAAVEKMFGKAESAKQFCEWAQWVNYDGYRAIFEGRSRCRRGVLLWMSHPAWPSMVWSTYDWWGDPTASYFGSRKACEPLHIQWNPVTRMVEIVNASAGDRIVTARAEVLDMYGKRLDWKEAEFHVVEDSTEECFSLDAPDEDVYFYRLTLKEEETPVSENFYVLGRETDNFTALRKLPKASVKMSRKACGDTLKVTLKNTGDVPAMMLHLTAVDNRGERILPVIWSDNYMHLLPGETRTLEVSARGHGAHDLHIKMEGFNL